MKIKEGFVLREIAGESVVIALGDAGKIFNGMIRLNETGRIIWERLSLGDDKERIVDLLLKEYEIERSVVERDVDRIIETLRGAGILE